MSFYVVLDHMIMQESFNKDTQLWLSEVEDMFWWNMTQEQLLDVFQNGLYWTPQDRDNSSPLDKHFWDRLTASFRDSHPVHSFHQQ